MRDFYIKKSLFKNVYRCYRNDGDSLFSIYIGIGTDLALSEDRCRWDEAIEAFHSIFPEFGELGRHRNHSLKLTDSHRMILELLR